MISLKNAKITKLREENNDASFSISPLPKGYGSTMGTVLRRTLLSSIPGFGITSVKINGVRHEYSTLSGVSDDVLAILLSLKNITFVADTLEPVELELTKKGSKDEITEVLASDFEANSLVRIINPDYVITKLTGEAKIQLTVKLERGLGYQQPKDSKRVDIDVLPLDANFSPVKLVSYNVEPARVGKDTELDELVLNIKTNGALTPEEALVISFDILKDGFDHLNNAVRDILVSGSSVLELNEKSKIVTDEVNSIRPGQSMVVADMNLSTRLTNALLRSGIDDLNKLTGMSEDDIENIRGLGNKSYLELLDIIKKYNIKLK